MPKRAIFINCARPDLVDYDAMRDAINEPRPPRRHRRHPERATRQEGDRARPLHRARRRASTGGFLYATPHIAASTDQAQLAIATETVRVIRSFLLEGTVPNVVRT